MVSSDAVAAVALAVLLGGCATAGAAPPSGAPIPQQFSCSVTIKAADEYMALPPDSALATLLDAYRLERKELWAYRNVPDPGCAKP